MTRLANGSFGVCLIVSALVVAGCQADDRTSINQDLSSAAKSAGRALETAWNSVSREAQKLTPKSSEESLRQARERLAATQKQLEQAAQPTPEQKKQLEATRQQIQRLDAAMLVQDLQRKKDAMLADAQAKADQAQKTAKDAQNTVQGLEKQLQQTNQSFQDLQRQIAEAQATYDRVTQQANAALSAFGLGGN